MSDRVRELRRHPSVRRVGGGLRPDADVERGIARPLLRAVPLESEPVSDIRSTRVRRLAVLIVAAFVVVMAIRFVFSPIVRL